MDMRHYCSLFSRCLFLTISIETMVLTAYFFIGKFRELSRDLIIRVSGAGIIASSITLPFIWFVFPKIIENRLTFAIVAELFAVIAEIPIIRIMVKSTWINASIASFIANGASLLGGFIFGISN